jgi:hypothetical protein
MTMSRSIVACSAAHAVVKLPVIHEIVLDGPESEATGCRGCGFVMWAHELIAYQCLRRILRSMQCKLISRQLARPRYADEEGDAERNAELSAGRVTKCHPILGKTVTRGAFDLKFSRRQMA